ELGSEEAAGAGPPLGAKVAEAYAGLGEFSVPRDRLRAANLTFAAVALTMYDMGAGSHAEGDGISPDMVQPMF
ncbi:unnamed protein product, partial [Heterosigma akashiwo]